ncbi:MULTISPECIES: hypothetical protein [Bacillales]|uniref:Uncharacterized protein n=1 Tax=Jeotgalibacillus terrae TaxID=587735 RepID=A0ABW5ZH13_9BACL|nr:hypothetical protein [Jeotgalibacillus terrae]MBM7581143.1 hypothetical protein [Jeotgalibacillus terrae]
MVEGATGFDITSAMLDPMVSSISSNAVPLTTAGVAIMAILVGVSLIPRIIYKFI